MLNDWFYSHPTWEVVLVVCAVLVVLALAGLVVFHHLLHWEARERHTSMVGLSYALAGGLYAVVIAFVAVGVYSAMDKGETIASSEANSLCGLLFDSAGLPAEFAARVRSDVDAYIDIVIKKEWPSQQTYRMEDQNFSAGWAQLRRIGVDLASFEPASLGQTTLKLEMVHGVNEVFSARSARLLAAKAHLPDATWQMMICGLVLVAVYLYLFGPHSFGVHMAVTGLTMVSIGLVFSFIIALDYPFRGDLSVGDEAFRGLKVVAATAFGPAAEKQAGARAEK
jgi:Protein of unknown function (DUF4239)